MNVNTLYVDVFLFNVVITLYSFFFSESNISMIRSKSSSLLNGILILPFPLAVHDSCTFEPKNPQRWLCSKVYSSDSLEPFGLIFFPPLSTVSPLLSALTISPLCGQNSLVTVFH